MVFILVQDVGKNMPAASNVEAVPLHKSQQVVQRDGVNIRIRLEVYDTMELRGIFARYGSDCWE